VPPKYFIFSTAILKISNKEGVNNLVTEADHASEKAILSVIKSHFPDHRLLAEEAEKYSGILLTMDH